MTIQRPSDLLERYAPAPEPVPESLLGDLTGRSADVVRLVPRPDLKRWVFLAVAAATVAGLVVFSTWSPRTTASPAASPSAMATASPAATSPAATVSYAPVTAAPTAPPTAPAAPVAGQVLYQQWWGPSSPSSSGVTTLTWTASDGSKWTRHMNAWDPTYTVAPGGYLAQISTLPSDPSALDTRMRELLAGTNNSDAAVYTAYVAVLSDGRATLAVRKAILTEMKALSGVTVTAATTLGGAPCTRVEHVSGGVGNLICIAEATATLVETGDVKGGGQYPTATLVAMTYVPSVPTDVRDGAVASDGYGGYIPLEPVAAPSSSPAAGILLQMWSTNNVATSTYTKPDGTTYRVDGSAIFRFAPAATGYLSTSGLANLPTDPTALAAYLRLQLKDTNASDEAVFKAYEEILMDGRAKPAVRTAVLAGLKALPSARSSESADVASRTCTRITHPMVGGTVSFVCIDASTGLLLETGLLATDGSIEYRSDLADLEYIAEVPAYVTDNAKPV